ncbi:YraN family protein [Candidatus Giovannonibacteria bacterium]|nr:YraN family protein [Candidatus Giovannonibacteria bacterium]
MPSDKRKFGDICENLAIKHLKGKSFSILERNYLKKWGEIDIIAEERVSRETHNIHFIEVKGHIGSADVRPESNVHYWKTKRLWRAIQTWFLEHPDYEDTDWQVDVMAVMVDLQNRKAKIRWTKNIML